MVGVWEYIPLSFIDNNGGKHHHPSMGITWDYNGWCMGWTMIMMDYNDHGKR